MKLLWKVTLLAACLFLFLQVNGCLCSPDLEEDVQETYKSPPIPKSELPKELPSPPVKEQTETVVQPAPVKKLSPIEERRRNAKMRRQRKIEERQRRAQERKRKAEERRQAAVDRRRRAREERQSKAAQRRIERERTQACCKICRRGCACGNGCISCAKTCRKSYGCACDG